MLELLQLALPPGSRVLMAAAAWLPQTWGTPLAARHPLEIPLSLNPENAGRASAAGRASDKGERESEIERIRARE